MKNEKPQIKIMGKTTDGLDVVGGLGLLYFQEGIPPSIIFLGLQRANMIPSWISFYEEFKQNGMSHKRIMHIFHEQIFEIYGREFRNEVINRLKSIYGEYE